MNACRQPPPDAPRFPLTPVGSGEPLLRLEKRLSCAAGARGYVDCTEIIRGQGVVSAGPIVKVTHPEAKVTHEAAIGSVDRQQLETLMARGLTPEEAVHRIVGGLLR